MGSRPVPWEWTLTVAVALVGWGLKSSSQVSKPEWVAPSARYHLLAGPLAPMEQVPERRPGPYMETSATTGLWELTRVETLEAETQSFARTVWREKAGMVKPKPLAWPASVTKAMLAVVSRDPGLRIVIQVSKP